MARNKNKNRVFRFNRRTRGLTDYALRLKLLKSGLTRAVVRRSNNNMLVQLVDYSDNGDKVLVSAKSNELIKLGWKNVNTGNVSAAYMTGYLAGKRAIKAKFKGECIVDMGLQRVLYGNRIFAAVKGLVDSGINVRVKDVVFPSQERLDGAHLKAKDAKKVIDKVKGGIDKL